MTFFIVPPRLLRRTRVADAYLFRGAITRAEFDLLMRLEAFVERAA